MTEGSAELEVLGNDALCRLEGDLRSALRRKPTHEAQLSGALRVLSRHSSRLQNELVLAVETMVRRSSFQRPLYGALVRALAEQCDRRLGPLLAQALQTESAGELVSLSAASLTDDPALADALAKLAASRHAHIAFAAEVARVARGESQGTHLSSIAPKIKEAHRIALCVELLVPLLWRPSLEPGICPALAVLRDSERHLGRWLVLAEVAGRAGDRRPLAEAVERAAGGPASARLAWTLVAWALDPDRAETSVRPTLELISRLSDRPSADKDTTFLFRLAEAAAPGARHMLENLARGSLLASEPAVRAALHLGREYGEARYHEQVRETAASSRREELRAFAAAALFDLGDRDAARGVVSELGQSRKSSALAWAGLVHAGARGLHLGSLVTEPNYRRVQLGWVE